MNEYLTDEAKRQLIEANIVRFVSDSFAHGLNRQIAVANGDEKAVAVAEEAIAAIDVAIATYQEELNGLVQEQL